MTVQPSSHLRKNDAPFSKVELVGIFYGASLGIGVMLGATTYVAAHFAGGDVVSAISLSTKVATASSSIATAATAAFFWITAPFKNISSEYKRRAASAVAGAFLAATECACVMHFSYVDPNAEPEPIIETPWKIAPPMIV